MLIEAKSLTPPATAPAPFTPPRQIDLPPTHQFGDGYYSRTIHIPAGTALIGKTHATDHIFMVTKGDITLYAPDGSEIRVKAPFMAICPAGVQRAGFAHADTVCTNIHITAETDLAALEAALICPDVPAMSALPEKQA